MFNAITIRRAHGSDPAVSSAAAASRALDARADVKITDPTSVVMIVNRDSNDIAFMDIKTNKMVGKVFLGNNVNPHMVMMSPDGRYVVTGGTRANKAYIIDARTLQLVKVINVDIAPEHLSFSPDSRWYYQGNPDGDSISVIDMLSLTKIKTIPGLRRAAQRHLPARRLEGLRRQLRRPLGRRHRRPPPRAAEEDPDRRGARRREARSGEVPRRDQGHQHRRAVQRRPLSLRRRRRPRRRRRHRSARRQGDQDHPRRQGPVAHLHEPRRQVRASRRTTATRRSRSSTSKANKVAATLEAGPDMTGVNFAAGKAFVISSTSGFVYVYDMNTLQAGRPDQDRHQHPARDGDHRHQGREALPGRVDRPTRS